MFVKADLFQTFYPGTFKTHRRVEVKRDKMKLINFKIIFK